jgi:protein tyrosine/serine phosphatase
VIEGEMPFLIHCGHGLGQATIVAGTCGVGIAPSH